MGGGGVGMLQELVRLTFAWGAMGAIVWFWYWLLSNIGTF
jgi:hypothetical protein